MEVKQINRILSLQMKKVKEDQARVNTTVSLVEMRLSEAKQLSPLFKLSTR